ncbi:TrlF family AAA-like ATPase [Rugamonas rubra]|uniref:ABC transporter n=1 Tax=Rugamonas rubra TaxID=758825 RepID=A0A1I4JC34_9BURK|nr:ABC transporter [Rugamonas rubra]SFL63791.1 hypothetical protein SAMN02982985_00901 [Rugamonas rubra]
MTQTIFTRGSEWRQWDLHIHTPASFHWDGARFGSDGDANRLLVDEMIHAMNAAEPQVFALMDYWTFDGWLALQKRLAEPGAPELLKTVFPGIELRLAAPTSIRLNAHVIFSNEVDTQSLADFKSALTVEIVNRPLSDSALRDLARQVGADKLKVHGFNKDSVNHQDDVALKAGSTIAEINCDSYKDAITKVPKGLAIGLMPYDTSDGLSEVKWHEHYAYFIGLFKSSPIFESRNLVLRSAFVGEETPENAKFFINFQAGLNNTPRLVVSGSDAHRFFGVKGDNDKRGYGNFPSNKATWIKADPTFDGLRQAIMEPAKRSFIGERPPKLLEVEKNKTYFIDSICVNKTSIASTTDIWLDGTALPLNADLVAIIGNKGSGKSALADVLALLGNSRQKSHFSFLKKDRFRGKSGDPAKQFIGILKWLDGSEELRGLNDDAPDDKVELVRYIPQGHFEDLCNTHVSGKSNAFENELRAVIFSHAGEDIRLGALDFDQLIDTQEKGYRSQLNEFRKELRDINHSIVTCEQQLQPEIRKTLEEQQALKERQIEEHEKLKPVTIDPPSTSVPPEQQTATDELKKVAIRLTEIDESNVQSTLTMTALAGKAKSIQNIRERVRMLERAHKQFIEETEKDFLTVGLLPNDVVAFTTNTTELDNTSVRLVEEQTTQNKSLAELSIEKEIIQKLRTDLQAKLDAPQLLYQQNLQEISTWTAKLVELKGAPESPDSLEGIKARVKQIDELPEKLAEYQSERTLLTTEIFDTLNAQRQSREALFKPVHHLIKNNSLIRDEYKLQFRATLGGSIDPFADTLFGLIKQNAGDFRGGEDAGYELVRKLAEQFDFNKRECALDFVKQLHEKITAAAQSSGKTVGGISSMLRKDKQAIDVYDLLFGLDFLEPRYSLLFQDTLIEQLSPGQRGALLLIFYLLVDKGRNPIILDQPEENLDNETVVSLLVPVLTEAKRRRQVIMVTHNPNLAVVCDAEQIIWATFDRKNKSKITYTAGSIEHPNINRRVVDVLEGTKPAFNNRRVKYH